MTLAGQLHDIADRLARLAPSHRKPEHFHEEKSELVAMLRRLASQGRAVAANDNDPRPSGRRRQERAPSACLGRTVGM